jgi:serine/threonine protein phosphatase PrpC
MAPPKRGATLAENASGGGNPPRPGRASRRKTAPEPVQAVACGCATDAGARYGSLNQDVAAAVPLLSAAAAARLGVPQACAALVLDGHGLLGEVAAARGAAAILAVLRAHFAEARVALGALPFAAAEALLAAAFAAGHAAATATYAAPPATAEYADASWRLVRGPGGVHAYAPARGSAGAGAGLRSLEFGTTAAVAVVQGRWLAVAHAGDSLVALARRGGASPARAAFLTAPHNCRDAAEAARVLAATRGRVEVRHDGYVVADDPVAGGRLALSMTRALGHRLMAAAAGVISRPDFSMRQLRPRDGAAVVVVASDGVWDELSPTAAAALADASLGTGARAASNAGAREAAAACVAAAVATATAAGRRADNATAAVLVLPARGAAD